MRYALAIVLTTLMAGCSSLTGTVGTNGAVCNVWTDITYSSKDTRDTIADIRIHNARREAWCSK